MNCSSRRRGTSLLEVAAVVALFGVLATIAVVGYHRVTADTVDTSRSALVEAVVVAQQTRASTRGGFTDDVAVLNDQLRVGGTYVSGDAEADREISVYVNGDELGVAVRSGADSCVAAVVAADGAGRGRWDVSDEPCNGETAAALPLGEYQW